MTSTPDVNVAFWIISTVILVAGFMVVSLRNIFHCALFLILCLSGVAGLFILLSAEFLAAAQVLIYVGAVAILIVFAVMLTSDIAARKVLQTNSYGMVALLACIIFAAGTIVLIKQTSIMRVWNQATELLPADNVLTVGKLLMTKFMLPFEVVSVLLLAAMIGAIVLARGEES